jgi:DNA polymerase-3 subunit delta'
VDYLNNTRNLLIEAARNGSLSQSLLLAGPRGIGRFSIVMDLARALLCEKDRAGCGQCSSCKDVDRLYHPDFLLLFPFPNLRPESKKVTVFPFSDPTGSGARFSEETQEEVERFREAKMADPFAVVDFQKRENIPVDVVKDLIRSLSRKPLKGGRRVAAVLEVDRMAFGAADLFLKTVEEPPLDSHLILTTSQPDLLLPTLLSRTHVIKIPPAPVEELTGHLMDRVAVDEGTAAYLSRFSGGSPGRAVYLYDGDVVSRRQVIMKYFTSLAGGSDVNRLIDEVNSEYGVGGISYDDAKIDFDIMESVIHDLYMLNENGLDNHLVNVDIKEDLSALGHPGIEVLDIWKACCAETRRACLVNNVAAGTAMMFFYISCADALQGPSELNFKLP